MTGTDPWNTTNTLDAATLDVMVTRLEARAQDDHFVRMLDQYLDAMKIDEAEHVLDLGCGTGVATRRICARKDFTGSCHGIDLSGYLIDAASRFAEQENLSGRTRFEAGDTHSLDIADSSYDAVVAHTLFSHVDDPLAVLAEAKRVVRPGGRIAVFDGDYASLTFELSDPERSKRDSESFISAVVAQPRVLRQMPRLAREQGLSIQAVYSNILTEVGEADFWVTAIEGFRKLGPKSKVMSEADANRWVDAQLQASRDGVFFGSSNYYAYIFQKS